MAERMKRYLLRALLAAILFGAIYYFSGEVSADEVELPTTYATNGQVTASNLNGNFNALAGTINGGLDNTNIDTSAGYRLFECASSLPTAGNQCRTVFNTSNNTLNFDNGSAFLSVIAPSGTAATGVLPYYNSGWTLLSPGSQYYSLISNGGSSLPSYQQVSLTAGVSGTLPVANGGTGQTTANTALNALLPSQTSNSGKILKTDGSNASWGTAGLAYVSTSQVSTSDNTGNVSITSTKYYRVVVSLNTLSTNDTFFLRFNNDSTGNAYSYSFTGRDAAGTAITGEGASQNQIALGVAALGDGATTNRYYNFSFDIIPMGTGGNIVGSGSYNRQTGSAYSTIGFSGQYTEQVPTSFRILTSGGATFSGSVLLYEYTTS